MRDIVLGEWSSGPDSEQDATSGDRNVIASMKVIRYGVSLKVIQSKRNFMVLICKQLMFLKFNGGRYVV